MAALAPIPGVPGFASNEMTAETTGADPGDGATAMIAIDTTGIIADLAVPVCGKEPVT
jgi:hypothetical protein